MPPVRRLGPLDESRMQPRAPFAGRTGDGHPGRETAGNPDSRNSLMAFEIRQRLSRDEGRAVAAMTHEHELADMADTLVHPADGKIVAND